MWRWKSISWSPRLSGSLPFSGNLRQCDACYSFNRHIQTPGCPHTINADDCDTIKHASLL
ncbi:hypothetical protein M405DRAFT_827078 [Rhizopogon salebrosus TDB-379]|nr:hypothetical protein M405DRAFT_827078 [Rhizopogon salebrosus TDB-379]